MDTNNSTLLQLQLELEAVKKENERLMVDKQKQLNNWKKSTNSYYNRKFVKGGVLDDNTVEENIKKRRTYYKEYHSKKRKTPVVKIPIEDKETHRKNKRKEYNRRAYLKRTQESIIA